MPDMTEFLAVLGAYWGETHLRAFLLELGIDATPKLRDGYGGWLHNHALGIEVSFGPAEGIAVPLRVYPRRALVLDSIRFYGERTGKFQPYRGELPFGLKFGTTRQGLIELLGPASSEAPSIGSMRWDRPACALFARLGPDETLHSVSLQLPVVASGR